MYSTYPLYFSFNLSNQSERTTIAIEVQQHVYTFETDKYTCA